MIMRHATRLLAVTAILSILCLLSSTLDLPSAAAADQRYASRQIKLGNVRPVGRGAASRRSLVAQAARGKVIAEAPPQRLVRGNVQQVGYINEPICGCGEACCDCGEVVCGVEPVCGVPVGCDCGLGQQCVCGVEAVCGVEVCEPGCGFVDECCPPACGSEMPACGLEMVACGSEMVDCGCDSCAPAQSGTRIFLPYVKLDWCRFAFFVGSQGFKGPPNFAVVNNNNNLRAGSGSFGYYQGVNEGRSLRPIIGADLAAQLGVRTTQNNLAHADFTRQKRYQVFLTGGVFRRVDFGLQFGLVFDYLHDNWYYKADLTQLRGELSWNNGCNYTYGFQYMVGVNESQSVTAVSDVNGNIINSFVDFEATNQYRLFLRRNLMRFGEGYAFAGWTDADDGLLGSQVDIPIFSSVLLNAGATYLIPKGRNAVFANQRESWNIAMGFTWRPGGMCGKRHSRPMFDVADNGTLMVRPRR